MLPGTCSPFVTDLCSPFLILWVCVRVEWLGHMGYLLVRVTNAIALVADVAS